MGVGGIFVTLRATTSKFNADMGGARAAVNRFRTSIVNINRQLKKVGKQMSQVGKSMSANFSLPIVAAGGLAVKTFAEFEQEMAKVQAVSGATGEEFKKLEKLAKDLGASTRFTASEVATLELNYSKLGFVPAQIAKITKPTLDLALATGEDLAQSAEVAGGTLRAFGLTADQMPRLVDLMAKSFSSSALTLDKFRDSMKSAAPVANAVGASLEDTTAIMSVLVDANIDASTAGTSLRNIFLELSAKGLTWNQAMGKIKNSTDKARTANELFGKRAVAAALVIANNTEKLDELSASYQNAEGSAAQMATIMDDTLQGSLLKVQSAIEGAAIELGETLAPAVKKVGEFIAELANKFSKLSPETKKMIAIVAGITAAVGPLLVVLGVLASTVLPALISGFALLLSPVVLIAAAIAAIGTAAVIVSNHINRLKGANQSLLETLEAADQAASGEIATLQKLVIIAKSDKLSRERRLKAINDLQEQYPDYLKNLTLENINSKEVAASLNKLKNNILNVARARAIEAKIQEIQAQKLELLTSQGASAVTTVDKLILGAKIFTGFLDRQTATLELQGIITERTTEANKAYDAQLQLLVDTLVDVEEQQDDLNIGTKTAADLAREAAEAEAARAKAAGFAGPTGIKGGGEKEKKAGVIIPSGDIKIFSDSLEEANIQLGMARDRAAEFSAAFTEDNVQSLQRQRDAIEDFINKSIEAGESVTSLQPQIDEFNRLGMAIDEAKKKQEQIAEVAAIISSSVAGAFTTMGNQIAESFIKSESAGGRFLQALAKSAIKIIAMALSTSIAQAIVGGTSAGKDTGIAAPIATPVFIATLVGAVLGAFAAIPKFAEGGLAFGATLGMLGEGRGISRANPEVIAPLDKLQQMIGGGGGQVEFILEGDVLRGVLQNTNISSEFNSPTVESFN